MHVRLSSQICFGIQEKIPCSHAPIAFKKQRSKPSAYLSLPVLPEADCHNPVRSRLLFFKIVAKQDLETIIFFSGRKEIMTKKAKGAINMADNVYERINNKRHDHPFLHAQKHDAQL
jgi:hypothetical protein